MKLKRGIKLLICCLAVMGLFSVNGLNTEAAACTHPIFRVSDNVIKETYHDAYSHYIIYGTQYFCPACGYTYWEDLYRTTAYHTWGRKIEVINGKEVEIIYCTGCNYLP